MHVQFLKLSYQWNNISRISKNVNKICSCCLWYPSLWSGNMECSAPPGCRAEITITHIYTTLYWDIIKLVIKYNKNPTCRSFSRFVARETLDWAHRFLSWIPGRLIHEPQGVCEASVVIWEIAVCAPFSKQTVYRSPPLLSSMHALLKVKNKFFLHCGYKSWVPSLHLLIHSYKKSMHGMPFICHPSC